MGNWRNSYYLRDLDNFTLGNGGSNISDAKTGQSSNSQTMSNPVEPNPSNPPVSHRKPVDMELNLIEPNPSQPPVRHRKPVDTELNLIEPNPSQPPVRHRKPVDTELNLIEPNPSQPPVSHRKPADTELNLIEPNPSKPPVSHRKPEDGDLDLIGPNPSNTPISHKKLADRDLYLVEPNLSNSTNDRSKIDQAILESAEPIKNDSSSKPADSASRLIPNTTKSSDNKLKEGVNFSADGIDKNDEVKSAANTGNSALQKNAAETNQQHTEHVEVSPKTKARDLLLSKRDNTDNAALAEFSHTSRRDILENRRNRPASIIVDYDTQGRDVTLDDFNVDGMDISINREHDGYGNEFDSTRTIETVKLANGQVVKCNIQDMVGANAESKAFADKHKGMTLPDGKYHFTADKLEKQADGTYNSACFQNTLRLQTKDSNIPKNIRDDINSKYFLFHATEYKKGFIPKKGNRIWINPWSAGCISSITGGQSTHDDFMNMLTGITPENISVTITSKRHVDI